MAAYDEIRVKSLYRVQTFPVNLRTTATLNCGKKLYRAIMAAENRLHRAYGNITHVQPLKLPWIVPHAIQSRPPPVGLSKT